MQEPIVVTGIGLLTSLGLDRESTWHGLRHGRSNVRRMSGLPGFGEQSLLAGMVDLPEAAPGKLKVIPMALQAAEEAVADAQLNLGDCDADRVACSVSAHMGDTRFLRRDPQANSLPAPWHTQWLPNTTCAEVANHFGCLGPRLSHSTACASSLISVLTAARAIRDGQCDVAICGGSDAVDPLFAAGFRQMRVLADHDDPTAACRPFDRDRNGFVMGEGAAILVIERLRHAMKRNAKIYAHISGGRMVAQAHHVTGLDAESESLAYLIDSTLKQARIAPEELGYINAHGTGTAQNDAVELLGVRRAMGEAADQVCLSSTKSMLGHMVNAAGAAELAVTLLAMRDGFAPPTRNLDHPDSDCQVNCLPWQGRPTRFQHALKLSLAFGGHLVAIALTRWNDPQSGFAYPSIEQLMKAA